MTKNGKIILSIIEASTNHPTAEELYRVLLDSDQPMSMATVYNNLNKLTSEGMIRKISVPDQPDHYDKLIPHDHLICKKCGKIQDMFLKNRIEDLKQEAGTPITSYDLQLFHICDNCKTM